MSGRDRFETWPAVTFQVGELLALEDGGTPLVLDPTQPHPTARRARTVVDLNAGHVGQQVLLAFEDADPARPIVMGVIRDCGAPHPGNIPLEADGLEMVVSAKHQLTLRCGRARITLTRAGKVLIEGTYVLSKSTGVNRIKGGSVQLN